MGPIITILIGILVAALAYWVILLVGFSAIIGAIVAAIIILVALFQALGHRV